MRIAKVGSTLSGTNLLPTMPIPDDLKARPIQLTENARTILRKRYIRRGEDGNPAETEHEMFWRVAYHVALAEAAYDEDVEEAARAYYDLLTNLHFFPNSPTFTGAGTPLGQLAACFVLKIEDDMGRLESGIFQTLRDAALIQQTGGGNGFSFSRLRPKGAIVKSSGGEATGPLGFLRVYDQAFGEIAQGGSRRGANMSVLRVSHPDIRDFITCKTNESHITNFNISVGITDEFMAAVEADADFNLMNPQNGEVWETVKAREIFDLIVKQAHHNGEPGVLFLDAANRDNPVPHLYELESTNPCGEQFLGPFENCCLGSINLANLDIKDGQPDWDMLQQLTETATRFLDDVVDANSYVPAVPQLAEAAHRVRRIGLGVMGLADLMYKMGVRYGSEEGQEFAGQVTEFVRYHSMKTSVELAKTRGAFPAIKGSLYDPDNFKWKAPTPLFPYSRDWGRPSLDWSKIAKSIKKFGIRNGAQTTVAPTGCLIPGTLVTTSHGVLPIETLGDIHGERWQNINLDVVSEDGNSTATQFYINGNAHTVKITTSRGYKLQGTDQHRIRVWEDGHWVWHRMDELKPGMRIPLQSTGLIGTPQRVALDTAMTTDFHATPITLPGEMTLELAYLLGFFMGDGSLKERSLRFSISDDITEQRLIDYMRTVFGIEAKVAVDNRSSRLKSVEFNSLNLVEFWRTNGFAKHLPNSNHKGKGYQPHIPLAVLRSNDSEIYGAFLAGLFDADGTVHNQKLLTWTTTDEQFHDQVKSLLLVLGILTTSDLQTTGMGQSTAYRLRTSHVEATDRLLSALPHLCRVIPCTDAIRRRTLGDVVPISEEEYSGLLSIARTTEEDYRRAMGWKQAGRVSRSTLTRFVGSHRSSLMEQGFEQLVSVIEENIFYDEIEVVEDGGWHNTYDISVPGPHAYIANGFVSHNTIATVSGCEGYGCEPVFALAYIRHVNDKGTDLQLQYTSPLFERALREEGLDQSEIDAIVEQVNQTGSCQNIDGLPESIEHTFVVSADITVEEHIRMQAAMQRFVDNAISKTINAPSTATTEDVAKAYFLGWKLGCKGLTVYVTGSRNKVVLETHATAKTKQEPIEEKSLTVPATSVTAASTGSVSLPSSNGKHTNAENLQMFHETKKPRPRRLVGRTYRIGTPLGGTYITVNENGHGEGHPFELFIHTSKAGSETAAISEAIGRLSSLILRMASPISPRDRVKEIIKQLEGIGGERSIGFGPQRVRSLPDGVAQVLREYLEETSHGPEEITFTTKYEAIPPGQMALKIGDLCPDCGEASVVNEEGCRKCYSCGYSEC